MAPPRRKNDLPYNAPLPPERMALLETAPSKEIYAVNPQNSYNYFDINEFQKRPIVNSVIDPGERDERLPSEASGSIPMTPENVSRVSRGYVDNYLQKSRIEDEDTLVADLSEHDPKHGYTPQYDLTKPALSDQFGPWSAVKMGFSDGFAGGKEAAVDEIARRVCLGPGSISLSKDAIEKQYSLNKRNCYTNTKDEYLNYARMLHDRNQNTYEIAQSAPGLFKQFRDVALNNLVR